MMARLFTTFLCMFYIRTVLTAEIRYYTVRNDRVDSSTNKTISFAIHNLIVSARQQRIDDILEGGSKMRLPNVQCQSLHKLFKKYKREFNSDQSMADETWHSVSSVSYLKVLRPKTTRIPLGIKSDITKNMIGCEKDSRFNFNKMDNYVDTQMEVMMKTPNDNYGYLIPPQICGPTKWYNLAPHHNINGYVGNPVEWTETKNVVRKWLEDEGGRIEVLIILQYKNLKMTRTTKGLPEGDKRPDGFATCFRLYDRKGVLRGELADTFNN